MAHTANGGVTTAEELINHHISSASNITPSNGVTFTRDENSWEEISIQVPWGTIQGKWWGPRNKQPILAFHGWQDNAGTFDRLCPLMTSDIPVLCIDLPGHGKSSHYPKGMQYFLFWDGICIIRRIVRKFGWKNVTLMGHSMGGALSFMYAASFPNEVDKLINIDIAGPPVRSLETNANRTGFTIDKFLDYEDLPISKMPCYSYDEMIKTVLSAYERNLDEESVKVMMRRGMTAVPDDFVEGYHFTRDVRLKVSSLAMFSWEQVEAYAKLIRCKVLNIRADDGLKLERATTYDDVINILKENCKLVIYETVPGTHHLHLVTPERVAPHINNFLLKS